MRTCRRTWCSSNPRWTGLPPFAFSESRLLLVGLLRGKIPQQNIWLFWLKVICLCGLCSFCNNWCITLTQGATRRNDLKSCTTCFFSVLQDFESALAEGEHVLDRLGRKRLHSVVLVKQTPMVVASVYNLLLRLRQDSSNIYFWRPSKHHLLVVSLSILGDMFMRALSGTL